MATFPSHPIVNALYHLRATADKDFKNNTLAGICLWLKDAETLVLASTDGKVLCEWEIPAGDPGRFGGMSLLEAADVTDLCGGALYPSPQFGAVFPASALAPLKRAGKGDVINLALTWERAPYADTTVGGIKPRTGTAMTPILTVTCGSTLVIRGSTRVVWEGGGHQGTYPDYRGAVSWDAGAVPMTKFSVAEDRDVPVPVTFGTSLAYLVAASDALALPKTSQGVRFVHRGENKGWYLLPLVQPHDSKRRALVMPITIPTPT